MTGDGNVTVITLLLLGVRLLGGEACDLGRAGGSVACVQHGLQCPIPPEMTLQVLPAPTAYTLEPSGAFG